MRKFRLLSLLVLASSFILVNCTKEGPEGPVGATGPQGPAGSTGTQGPAGPAGSANVIYSNWVALSGWADTTFTNLSAMGIVSRSIRTAPGVTQAIIDQGIVLTYLQNGPGGVTPLPFSVSPNLHMNFLLAPGKIFFYFSNPSTGTATGAQTSALTRYVIVPGGVAGGRGISEKIAEINGRLYSETELKTMSYQEICSLLNIAL